MVSKQRDGASWSKVWSLFEEIYENDTKLSNFVRCKECECIIFKPTSNTNKMNRHRCQTGENPNKRISFDPSVQLFMKEAASQFIAKDLRPFSAVECEGLLDLCAASMKFGQLYRRATRENLADVMPCRNTVRNMINQIAESNRAKISHMIKRAIETGGIAATTDTWQDNYRKGHYMSIVAHMLIEEKPNIIQRFRYVLCTREIPDLSKKGIHKIFLINIVKNL